jgi:glycerophosphoryl diester phosphodiesterase
MKLSPFKIIREALGDLRRNFRVLLTFHLFSFAFTLAITTPAVLFVLQVLVSTTGEISVSNESILSFLTSPLGIFWLIVVAASALGVFWAEMAGMMMISRQGWSGRGMTLKTALWVTIKRIPGITVLGYTHVVAHLLLASPFIIIGLLVFTWLQARFDLNYLVTEKPPELYTALAIGAVLGLGVLILNGRLFIRWVFSLPALLFSDVSTRESIRQSRRLVRATGWKVVPFVVLAWITLVSIPEILIVGFRKVGKFIFFQLTIPSSLLYTTTVLYLALFILVSIIVQFLVVVLLSLVLVRLYSNIRVKVDDESAAPVLMTVPDHSQHERLSRAAFGALVLLLLMTVGMTLYVLPQINMEDRAKITAHRGSSFNAPENTLSAIERAIEDGAHYAEIDVQMTSDGHVVVFHDSDFMRMAGSRSRVSEMTLDEIRQIDVGSWFSPDFKGERVPTLNEAISLARDRIRLNIELKVTADIHGLADAVVQILHNEKFVDQSLVTSLNSRALVRVQEQDPDIRTGYIIARSIGNVAGIDADAIIVESQLATPMQIFAVQRKDKELHVWTVNHPVNMVTFIEIGVDNILTDRPELLAQILKERADLSPDEYLLLRIQNALKR